MTFTWAIALAVALQLEGVVGIVVGVLGLVCALVWVVTACFARFARGARGGGRAGIGRSFLTACVASGMGAMAVVSAQSLLQSVSGSPGYPVADPSSGYVLLALVWACVLATCLKVLVRPTMWPWPERAPKTCLERLRANQNLQQQLPDLAGYLAGDFVVDRARVLHFFPHRHRSAVSLPGLSRHHGQLDPVVELISASPHPSGPGLEVVIDGQRRVVRPEYLAHVAGCEPCAVYRSKIAARVAEFAADPEAGERELYTLTDVTATAVISIDDAVELLVSGEDK